MFRNALMWMANCVANILCITQMTLIFVDNALSIDQGWLFFAYLEFVPNFWAIVNRLYVYVNFTAEVFQLSSDSICRFLILERQYNPKYY